MESQSRRSRRRSGRTDESPEFLIDRSLGRHKVPAELRALGLVVHTLADLYGEDIAQETEDLEWLGLAARRHYVVILKDDRIRRRPAELAAVEYGELRVFCLTNANLPFDEMARWFRTNVHRIVQRSRKPGPFIDGVYKDRVDRLWPK